MQSILKVPDYAELINRIGVKAIAPQQAYWGFEPNLECYCYARTLIAANQLDDCRLFPFGLGDRAGMVELFHNGRTDPAASTVKDFRDDTSHAAKQYVTILRGDDVLQSLPAGEVSTIKIDVEGAELEVQNGLSRTLAQHRPFVICEIPPTYDEQSDCGRFRRRRHLEIEVFLSKGGYRIHRIEPEGDLMSMREIPVHGDLARTNYLFTPTERDRIR